MARSPSSNRSIYIATITVLTTSLLKMWLRDTSHGCNNYSVSWIEAGEATQPGKTGNYYFWGDCRPGFDFAPHFLKQPPSGDVGQYFEYIITYAGTNTYSVACPGVQRVGPLSAAARHGHRSAVTR